MTRRKTIASIESQINKVKMKISNTKKRYDQLCDELEKLQAERDSTVGLEIVEAMKRSGKTYSEIMTFLGKP